MWEEEGDVKAIDNVKDRKLTRPDLLLGLAVGKLQLQAMDAAKDVPYRSGPSCAMIKKEEKKFLIYKEIQKGAVRSHVWLL